ncbi:hypothetical protein DKX38_017780 [Salix brachista]|uniref:Uncharacterized protein n=1 Tax=Salix brachista TaxID=2182728 RepID=A0A5N5KW67_9ROSI|nr:hypothetical protein DKX38_017780 [Salix brachista]
MGSNGRFCKYEVAFKSMAQKSDHIGAAESVKNICRISTASGADSNEATGMNSSADEDYRRKRREEKAKALLNLICWGPK